MLRAGVVSDRFLPLDGILMYQAHRDKEGDQVLTVPGAYSSQGGVSLPLDTVQYPNHDFSKWYWYYKCSWAQWSEGMVEARDFWNKRLDLSLVSLVDPRTHRSRIRIDQGEYKAYHAPIYYRSALWVEWYCVGERAQIEYLLSTVGAVGKKQAQGWGRVSAWTVEPVADDYSVWYGDELMRGVPPEHAPGWAQGVYGIRPSYWKRENQMLLALPS